MYDKSYLGVVTVLCALKDIYYVLGYGKFGIITLKQEFMNLVYVEQVGIFPQMIRFLMSGCVLAVWLLLALRVCNNRKTGFIIIFIAIKFV